MEFPFSDKQQYLTEDEQAHLNEFFKFEPEGKVVYENDAGEKRLPLMVKRPRGCIAPDTVWCTDEFEDGRRLYHTPLAKYDGKVALIYYRNPDTMETATCNSIEWLEWLGKGWKTKDKPKPALTGMDKYVENQKDAIVSGNIQKVSQEEFDRNAGGDQPEWQPAIPKKSPGTSPTKSSAKRSKKSSPKK